MLWYYFHQIWWPFDQIHQNWWKFSGLLISWNFWGSVKFGDKSCVNNVTKFGETKCCDIIYTKFGEILITFTKHGENSNVYKKYLHFFPPNLVIFRGCRIYDFFGKTIFTKYGENGSDSLSLWTKNSQNFVNIFKCKFVILLWKYFHQIWWKWEGFTKIVFWGNHQIWSPSTLGLQYVHILYSSTYLT